MEVKEKISFEEYKRSIGECVFNTKGKAKKCDNCYKKKWRRCEW